MGLCVLVVVLVVVVVVGLVEVEVVTWSIWSSLRVAAHRVLPTEEESASRETSNHGPPTG